MFGVPSPATDFAAAKRLYSCHFSNEMGWMDLQGVTLKSGRCFAGITPVDSLTCEGEGWGGVLKQNQKVEVCFDRRYKPLKPPPNLPLRRGRSKEKPAAFAGAKKTRFKPPQPPFFPVLLRTSALMRLRLRVPHIQKHKQMRIVQLRGVWHRRRVGRPVRR